VIGAGTLAVILLVFFVAGIGAGVVVVIALSARRTRQPPRPDWPEDGTKGIGWTTPSRTRADSATAPGGSPRWPG
jgi:hypothetical protein